MSADYPSRSRWELSQPVSEGLSSWTRKEYEAADVRFMAVEHADERCGPLSMKGPICPANSGNTGEGMLSVASQVITDHRMRR